MSSLEQVDVVLIYPQRAPVKGRHWIMPSLGLSYLNSALRSAGYSCRHLDHTFLERREVLAEIERLKPRVIGIYCMVTMQDEAFSLARDLKGKALLVVGGPYRCCRNPMYLGHLIFLAGLVLALHSWIAAGVFAFHLAWFDRRVRDDEARLAALFGDPYREYLARVRRWIPGLP